MLLNDKKVSAEQKYKVQEFYYLTEVSNLGNLVDVMPDTIALKYAVFGPGGLRAPCVLACAMRSLAIVNTIVQSFFLLSFFFSSPFFAFDPLQGISYVRKFVSPNILAKLEDIYKKKKLGKKKKEEEEYSRDCGLVMPKYWGVNYFAHGRFLEVGQKQKIEKKEEEEYSRDCGWPRRP